MKLLLSSNSTLQGEPYLQFCKEKINEFLSVDKVKNVVFIPYAAVRFSYGAYEQMVVAGLDNDQLDIQSIHRFDDRKQAVLDADAIIVGGGNTFHLLNEMYSEDLLDSVRNRVKEGVPYVGWSAGSNLACPSVMTTNDMPIIFPPSFDALGLIPFQINPHYIHGNPPGHNGETREERLEEFIEVNQSMLVVGLREGTMLEVRDDAIQLIGDKSARLFGFDKSFYELGVNDDFSFLMKDSHSR